jgi:predicted Zn-dependent protease
LLEATLLKLLHVKPILALCMAGIVLSGCSAGRNGGLLALEDEKAAVKAVFSSGLNSSAEAEQIYAASATSRATERAGLSSNKRMVSYLQKMALAFASGIGAEDQNFKVVVLKGGQANAFTPGAGTIIINEGLLRYCESEAELAAVMAHEMAHVLMRHPIRQKQIRLAGIAGEHFMDKYTPESLAGTIGRALRLSGRSTLNGMMRQQEMMADSIGIDIMVKAGYDPRALLSILRTLRAVAPQKDRLTNVIYGNHPLTIDREAAVTAKIKRNYVAVFGTISTPTFDELVRPYHKVQTKRLAANGP